MFYLARKLKTNVTFLPYEMNNLARNHQIMKRVKEKVEGHCFNDYGFIVQIPTFQGKDDKNVSISLPVIEDERCLVTVEFSAICFKAEKNDIIDVIVTEVNEDYILGKMGPAEVNIPKVKMDVNLEFLVSQNCFTCLDQRKIQRGAIVRCKVFEVIIKMGVEMKIIASLPFNLLIFSR